MADMLLCRSNSQNYVKWRNADLKDKKFNDFMCRTFLESSRNINRGDHRLPVAENGGGGWWQMSMRELSGVPTELKSNGNGIDNPAEFSQYHWLNPDNQGILKSISRHHQEKASPKDHKKTKTLKETAEYQLSFSPSPWKTLWYCDR